MTDAAAGAITGHMQSNLFVALALLGGASLVGCSSGGGAAGANDAADDTHAIGQGSDGANEETSSNLGGDDTGTANAGDDTGIASNDDTGTMGVSDTGTGSNGEDTGTTAHDGGAQDSGSPSKDAGTPPSSAKIVAYYATWTRSTMPPSSIPWSQLTHIAHAFFLPSSSGGLTQVASTVDAELISTAHAHGVKVVASVGGAGASFTFASNATTRAATVAAMADLCKTYGYDGIDIDWEFPTTSTAKYWADLVAELRTALDAVKPGLTISAAVGSSAEDLDPLPTASLESLDWIGVMTYDYAGDWSASSGYDAPLYASKGGDGGSVSQSIAYAVKTRALPASKVFMGLPFYGHSFGCSSLASTPVAPSDAPDYRDIEPLPGTSGWTKAYDAAAQVPFLTRSASPGFMSYDDAQSISAKCSYAKSQALGGVIIWHLAGDRLSDGTNPLLKAAQGCR